MPPSRTSSARRLAVVVLASVVSLLAVAGCTSAAGDPRPSATSASGGTGSRSATVSPTGPASDGSGSSGTGTTPNPSGASSRPGTTVAGASAAPWLLSLGDSLGFGLQEEPFVAALQQGYQASDFGGYVTPLAAALRRHSGASGLKVVNYACPGETTDSMLRGHCPIPPALLHDPFTGPQQQAALTWLAAHRREPGVIVVSIGANDLLPVISCSPQPECGQQRLASTRTALLHDLAAVVAQLRAAAPQARLLYLAPYNPYADTRPASQQVANGIAPEIVRTARRAGATVVDGYAVIDGSGAAARSQVTAAERARICRLTLFCQPRHRDVHPSDAGYAALAQSLAAAVPSDWP